MRLKLSNKSILINSIPVAIGYLFLGFSFGVLFTKNGGTILQSVLISITAFAGAAQFMAINFYTQNNDFVVFFIAVVMINIRHIVYGISVMNEFGQAGIKKAYLICALTDENFGMFQDLKRKAKQEHKSVAQADIFKIFILNHFYWVLGTFLGSALNSAIVITIKGLDFALTALFLVILTEQLRFLYLRQKKFSREAYV